MEQAGHTVVNAYDGEKGLELAQEAAPDLILFDLILPKMDGFSVLEKLKGDQKTKDIPVIVLTNLESVDDVEKVIGLGATTYLVKANYDLNDIAGKINEVLRQK